MVFFLLAERWGQNRSIDLPLIFMGGNGWMGRGVVALALKKAQTIQTKMANGARRTKICQLFKSPGKNLGQVFTAAGKALGWSQKWILYCCVYNGRAL